MSLSCDEIDIHGECRLCGSEDGIKINIFEPGSGYVKKIHKILPITVNEHDLFPKNMCHRCSFKVNEFFEFRSKCIITQEVFKSKIPWLKNRRSQTRNFNNDIPPMVELPLDPMQSISPNEKQILRRSIEENDSTIVIDDDSQPHVLSNAMTNNETHNHQREKIIMKIKTSHIRKRGKQRSIWDVKKRKRRPNKTFKIAEVFTTPINDDLNDANENNSLETPSDENKNLKTENPGTNQYHRESIKSEENLIENINLPEYILVTNIPRVGNIYTCEKCGRTFLTPQPASLHDCEASKLNKSNSSGENEKVSSSPDEVYYTCEECNQVFTRQSLLVAHQRKHEVMDISSDDNVTPKPHYSKKKQQTNHKENTFTLGLNPSEPTLIKHSLLSSDSE